MLSGRAVTELLCGGLLTQFNRKPLVTFLMSNLVNFNQVNRFLGSTWISLILCLDISR